MELSFILNELGENRSDYFNAIAPPIIQTSNFQVRKVDELRNLFADESSGYLYSRGINPTVDILRENWQRSIGQKMRWSSTVEQRLFLRQYWPIFRPMSTL